MTHSSKKWTLPESPCDLCKSKNYFFIHNLISVKKNEEHNLKLVKCSNCKVLRSHPYISDKDLGDYYLDDYSDFNTYSREKKSLAEYLRKLSFKNTTHKSTTLKEKLLLILAKQLYGGKHKFTHKKGTLLDVGCGDGTAIYQYKKFGYDVYGIDPYGKSINECKKKQLNNTSKEFLSKKTFGTKRFDIVRLWNVLEHTNEPLELIKLSSEKTNKNGEIIISIPNPECLSTKIFKDAWILWDPPRHRYLFDKKTIIPLLKKHGFSDIKIKTYSMGVWLSSYNKAKSKNIKHKLIWSIEKILDFILDIFQAGDTLEIKAIKK